MSQQIFATIPEDEKTTIRSHTDYSRVWNQLLERSLQKRKMDIDDKIESSEAKYGKMEKEINRLEEKKSKAMVILVACHDQLPLVEKQLADAEELENKKDKIKERQAKILNDKYDLRNEAHNLKQRIMPKPILTKKSITSINKTIEKQSATKQNMKPAENIKKHKKTATNFAKKPAGKSAQDLQPPNQLIRSNQFVETRVGYFNNLASNSRDNVRQDDKHVSNNTEDKIDDMTIDEMMAPNDRPE